MKPLSTLAAVAAMVALSGCNAPSLDMAHVAADSKAQAAATAPTIPRAERHQPPALRRAAPVPTN